MSFLNKFEHNSRDKALADKTPGGNHGILNHIKNCSKGQCHKICWLFLFHETNPANGKHDKRVLQIILCSLRHSRNEGLRPD